MAAAPTVFICAPQGAGKSLHAETLRKLFGCTSILDEWDGESVVPEGALVLTHMVPGERAALTAVEAFASPDA